ncbi:MAG: hypothetical protein ACO1OB_15815 [Archangium sp.]
MWSALSIAACLALQAETFAQPDENTFTVVARRGQLRFSPGGPVIAGTLPATAEEPLLFPVVPSNDVGFTLQIPARGAVLNVSVDADDLGSAAKKPARLRSSPNAKLTEAGITIGARLPIEVTERRGEWFHVRSRGAVKVKGWVTRRELGTTVSVFEFETRGEPIAVRDGAVLRDASGRTVGQTTRDFEFVEAADGAVFVETYWGAVTVFPGTP